MKIRYHHLLCLPRFEGKGYSDTFCENLKEILPRFNAGDFELTDKNDDFCTACPNLIDGVCRSEEKVKRYDAAVMAALRRNVLPSPKDVCSDCEWYSICKDK